MHNSGIWEKRQKAEIEVWCKKNLHNKFIGECFRRGYQFIGSKFFVPNIRKKNILGKYCKWTFEQGTRLLRKKKVPILSTPNTLFWIFMFTVTGFFISKKRAKKTYKKLY